MDRKKHSPVDLLNWTLLLTCFLCITPQIIYAFITYGQSPDRPVILVSLACAVVLGVALLFYRKARVYYVKLCSILSSNTPAA